MQLATGTKIRWESAAGVKRGTIKNIVLSPAANGVITPWIDVEVLEQNHFNTVRLCASAPSLMMFQVELVA
jgi:hypothetical protein